MSDADRLRRAIKVGYRAWSEDRWREARLPSVPQVDPIQDHICRAIVKEFGLDANCKCRLGHHCESCAKMVLLGDAIIDVAEADDE